MSPEASQIQRGIRRQHWGPARDVQPAILTLRLRVDHVFAVMYWNVELRDLRTPRRRTSRTVTLRPWSVSAAPTRGRREPPNSLRKVDYILVDESWDSPKTAW